MASEQLMDAVTDAATPAAAGDTADAAAADTGAAATGNSAGVDDPTSLAAVASTLESTLLEIWQQFIEHTPYLVAGVLTLGVTWVAAALLNRIGHKVLSARGVRRSLQDLLLRLIAIGVWVAGLLLAAMFWFPGLTPTSALGGIGLVSIAVGFAFQDIFANFFAGILLLWRFPFEKGDFIECEGLLGKVEEISVRMTMIRKTDGELLLVPNNHLFQNPVRVLTDQDRRRLDIDVGVAYDEDVEQCVDIIERTMAELDTVDQDLPVQVYPKAFGASSIDIEVTWWTEPRPGDHRKSRAEVVTAIKAALDREGIEIPYPYRTLVFKQDSGLAQLSGRDARGRGGDSNDSNDGKEARDAA